MFWAATFLSLFGLRHPCPCSSLVFLLRQHSVSRGHQPRLFSPCCFGPPCPLGQLAPTFPSPITVLVARVCPRAEEGAMSRNRLFIILGGCLLAASAAWADDVGYVECSSHPDGTQVFSKPRKSPEVVASMACGERFTILVYGFVFSRVQTGDGKIGYVYSNLIAVDRDRKSTRLNSSHQIISASEKVAVRTAPVPGPAHPSAS